MSIDTTPTTRATEEGDPTPTALPPPTTYTVPDPPAPAEAGDRASATAAGRRYTTGLLTGEAGQSWAEVVMSLEPVVTPAHRSELAATGPTTLARTTRARVTSATQVQSGAWRYSAEVYDLAAFAPGAAAKPTFQVWDLTILPTAGDWRVQAATRIV